MYEKQEVKVTKLEFRPKKKSDPIITMSLTGATAEIHKSPEKLRALMEMLELPEGTIANITVEISTAMVR